MGRAARIVTMWINDYKVHVSLRGDADADLVDRLEIILARLLQSGATHMVVHLGRLTGDDTAVVAILAGACQRLWLQQGIMETIGMRDRHVSVPPPREAPEVVEEEPSRPPHVVGSGYDPTDPRYQGADDPGLVAGRAPNSADLQTQWGSQQGYIPKSEC